jgi:hypothetical protein
MAEIRFGPCCFCAKDVERTGPDPCSVQVTTAAEKWQVWTCHGACFKAALAAPPEAPSLFEPAHF